LPLGADFDSFRVSGCSIGGARCDTNGSWTREKNLKEGVETEIAKIECRSMDANLCRAQFFGRCFVLMLCALCFVLEITYVGHNWLLCAHALCFVL
jgi:hypothetical protein